MLINSLPTNLNNVVNELPRSVVIPDDGRYIEFFGFAGAGKSYLCERLGARHVTDRPILRALDLHLVQCFVFFLGLMPLLVGVKFEESSRSRVGFARHLFKRILLIRRVCHTKVTWYCAHGVCQEFLKLAPSKQRDKLMAKVFQFLQPYATRITIVCVMASVQTIIDRRIERAAEKDLFEVDEMRRRSRALFGSGTLEDLCSKISVFGCGVELVLFENHARLTKEPVWGFRTGR